METKEIVGIAAVFVAGFSAIIGYLKYRFDKIVAHQSLLPKNAKPYVMVKHTTTTSNSRPDKHIITVEVANRDDRNIAIKSVHWWLDSIRTRWDFELSQQSPNTLAQLPYKLATSELFQLVANADYTDSLEIMGPIMEMSGFERSIAICNLSVEVALTTGECTILRTPFAFREMLINWHSRPIFLRPFFKWHIKRHP
jgi:hypothetical protein